MSGRPYAEVSVAVLREAFAASGLTISDVARAAGHSEAWAARIVGDRIQYDYRGTRRYARVRHAVRYETAVKVCRAMGLDPVDLGL